jgi:sugar phosphate permease
LIKTGRSAAKAKDHSGGNATMQDKPITMGRRRWRIGALLGIGVLVNYFDRINLSVAAPALSQEFAMNAAQLGLLFSAFAWSYAFLQIPTGMVLDRFGVTAVGRIGTFLWGIASAITALATGYGQIFAARLLLGIVEAPAFPANSKATGYWFPRQERGLATALFDSASKFSNVIGVPVVAFAVVTLGWRGAFLATAALSFVYFLAFLVIYRDPSKDLSLTDEERRHIVQGGATPEGRSEGSPAAMLGYVLRSRKVWGLTIGFACYGYSISLYLSWLPDYLVRTMHMGIMKSAGYTAIPWLVGTATDLLIGGWLIDHFVGRGFDETLVRKTVLVGGMLTGLAVFGAAFTTDPNWAILWISIALGGLAAAAPAAWALPSLVSPRGGTGTIGGIMNFANASIGGIAAPIVTGFIVAASDSFQYAFIVAGGVLAVGVFSYLVVLGKIEPLPDLMEAVPAE